jgi:hypothetical protein
MSNIDYSALINDEETLAAEPATLSLKATNAADWQNMDGYIHYDDFADENISIIDKKKNISLDKNQVNLTQERYSQFIPFEIDRFQDGIDLKDSAIVINYMRPGDELENSVYWDTAVNAKFSDDKIRFGWLVNDHVTEKSGVVKFEIAITTRVSGVDADGNTVEQPYTWKSRTNAELIVDASLGKAMTINWDEDAWEKKVVDLVATQIANANLSQTYYNKTQIDNKLTNTANSAKTYTDNKSPTAVQVHMEDGYKIYVTVTTGNGTTFTSSKIDLPLESVVVNARYDEATRDLILTLQNGTTTAIPLDAIFTGLATETFVNNKITESLIGYATETFVNEQIGLATEQFASERLGDITDQEGTPITVAEYVKTAVDSVDVTEELKDYITKVAVSTIIGEQKTTEEGTPIPVMEYIDGEVDKLNKAIEGVDNDLSITNARFGTLQREEGVNLTVQEYVDSIDISGRLGDLGTNEDETPKTVE